MNRVQLNDLKVIIIGQDPYPTEGVANGVAFACESPQPSFQILLNELKKEYGNHSKIDTQLNGWTSQGVMLINSALTCEISNPGCHTFIWESFVGNLLKQIQDYNFDIMGYDPIVFVPLGRIAKAICEKYLNPKMNPILFFPHPASEVYSSGSFIGCDIFKKINEKLKENNINEIKWSLT